ncbi:flagellar hook assembly protein FlgD [Henriciella aquimarina]|uniref:flagellar hook assembly protein FlgD n=1 Tax=Henriciella aquimarina TaxID=545261 RepID=UPI000A07BD8F|nr:flagellar hook capping FlgD N-terminal domain-containing protein [Henriciella aquimarina]
MSTVNPAATSQTQQSQANAQASQTKETSESSENKDTFGGEDFNTFIRLLTAQVQNQDPMKPLDSTQFVEQLATFSSLEQQVRSNDSLQNIATMIGDLHSMLANDWLGKTVAVESSWVPYSGEAVQYSMNMPEGAERAVLNIRNSEGETVWTEDLDPEAETYSWDGSFEDGGQADSDSVFEFAIDTYQGDAYLGTIAPKVITTVTDVGNENGTTRVGTSSKLTADVRDVEKVD